MDGASVDTFFVFICRTRGGGGEKLTCTLGHPQVTGWNQIFGRSVKEELGLEVVHGNLTSLLLLDGTGAQ